MWLWLWLWLCISCTLTPPFSWADRNGPVWSGLTSRPDQTSCLHNNRSGLTGQTSKTAKNKAEVVEGRKRVYYITSYRPHRYHSRYRLYCRYQARRYSHASIISAFSLPRRSTISFALPDRTFIAVIHLFLIATSNGMETVLLYVR